MRRLAIFLFLIPISVISQELGQDGKYYTYNPYTKYKDVVYMKGVWNLIRDSVPDLSWELTTMDIPGDFNGDFNDDFFLGRSDIAVIASISGYEVYVSNNVTISGNVDIGGGLSVSGDIDEQGYAVSRWLGTWASAPPVSDEGDMYYNSSSGKVFVKGNSTWVQLN